jgi:translation elongation factor EF-Ts
MMCREMTSVVRPVVDVGQLVAKSEVKVLEVLTEGLGEERAEEGFADELLAWAEGGRESEEVFVVSGEPVGDVVG